MAASPYPTKPSRVNPGAPYLRPGAQTFTQKTGPRAGQDYQIRRGESGKPIRVYETGDTAVATGKPRQQVVDLVNRSYGPNLPRSEGTPVPDLKKAAETVRRGRIKNFSAKGRKPSRQFPRK